MDAAKKLLLKLKGSPKSQNTNNNTSISPPNQDIKPRSILKNPSDANKYRSTDSYPISEDLDESLGNAQKNCSLNKMKTSKYSSPTSNTNYMSNDIEDNEIVKDFRWDEQNLQQNEDEKVPRMKIDEPKTPFQAPISATNEDYPNYANMGLVENEAELILDENPMDMNVDVSYARSVDMEVDVDDKLKQNEQSLLLADDQFRQKMVKSAVNERISEWDISETNINSNVSSSVVKNKKKKKLTAKEIRKQKFKAKRSAHYNEFHAIKAMLTAESTSK